MHKYFTPLGARKVAGMEKPGTDDTVSNILLPRSIYIYLTQYSVLTSLPNSFQLYARELMKIKVKGRLLFSSCYVKLKSLLINECQENTYYHLSCSLSSRLCLQESQAFSFNSTEGEIFWNRGGRAGSLPTTTQGGQTRPCELHRSPMPHTAASSCHGRWGSWSGLGHPRRAGTPLHPASSAVRWPCAAP